MVRSGSCSVSCASLGVPYGVRSCLILGSGRSGTSMLAGVLAGAGYYMGDNLWPARDANPKGFFEDVEINSINEELIATVTPQRPRRPLGLLYHRRPVQWQRWLAEVAPGTTMPVDARTAMRIGHQAAREPFCFKDPRFCYTLPAWRPFIGAAALVCIFRSPAETAASILKDCREAPYLRDLTMNRSRALALWNLAYRHVLDVHRFQGEWLFVHYEQILDGSAAPRLEVLLGVSGDWAFPEASLRRSAADGPPGTEAERTYLELCRLAGYEATAAGADHDRGA